MLIIDLDKNYREMEIMRYRLIFLVGYMLLLILAITSFAEEWMTFTTDDGLAHNECRCVAVDHDGVVWVGSGDLPTCTGGVSSWDGETWTTYYSWTTDFALRSNVIYDISVDSENNKWFATGAIGSVGGVTKYDGETWTYYNLDSLSPFFFEWVKGIQIDSEGKLWCSGAVGICIIDSILDFVHSVSILDRVEFTDIILLPDNRLVFATSTGLIYYNGVEFSEELHSTGYYLCMLESRMNEIWFGTISSGLFLLKDSLLYNYTLIDDRTLNNICSFVQVSPDEIWFANYYCPKELNKLPTFQS